MPKGTSKLDMELDVGKYIPAILKILFIIGSIWFCIWFYFNNIASEEKAYIKSSRYVYDILQKETISFYKEKGYVFNEKNKEDKEFCEFLVSKYAKNKIGSCANINPLIAQENFVFKNKKISVYGLEKPAYSYDSSIVKDIMIDVNTDKKGDNQIGSDRLLLRIYSTGLSPAVITPINCSKQDEKEYGLKTSTYCIGSPEINYLAVNKPLGFDIERIGAEDGKTKIISSNTSYLRADCSAFGGFVTGAEDYCSDKSLYTLRGCDDEYSCNIALTKY